MGSTPNDWPAGAKWGSKVLGYELKLPFKVDFQEAREEVLVNKPRLPVT
jgi:hypothetical protein